MYMNIEKISECMEILTGAIPIPNSSLGILKIRRNHNIFRYCRVVVTGIRIDYAKLAGLTERSLMNPR